MRSQHRSCVLYVVCNNMVSVQRNELVGVATLETTELKHRLLARKANNTQNANIMPPPGNPQSV